MTKNIKFFFIGFLAAFIFGFLFNTVQSNFEDFFFVREINHKPPHFFVAQIATNYQETPILTPENCQISAAAAISILIDKQGREKTVFEKNTSEKMPIASLTKLMTAIVASEFYPLSSSIEIAQRAVAQAEASGYLTVGEVLKVEDLLHLMLIESSNDAAFALSEPMSVAGFVAVMNLKAESLGLTDSYFYNPAGIDPDYAVGKINYSTAKDLGKLGKYLLKKPEILAITAKKEYSLFRENGTLHHILTNTNQLLGEIPEIIGGKTGQTNQAGGCLFLILEDIKPNSYLINVVLNSPNRFEDMRSLINCIQFNN